MSLFTLRPGEHILKVINKHWFVFAKIIIGFSLLLVPAPVATALLPLFLEGGQFANLLPLIDFLAVLYALLVLLLLFLFWMDYYLDMWVITDFRIIDIEQYGLFSRQVAEIPLKQVQDVTVEVHGVLQTFLRFGAIRIQTAGEREFAIEDIPRLEETKELILTHAHKT